MRRSDGPVRVLMVDDSPVALNILRRILSGDPQIEVVGTYERGSEALAQIPRLHPDVLCTDLHMPGMDGLELIRQVMSQWPLPILVVSVSVQTEQKGNVFRMLEAGAVDVFPKPRSGFETGSEEARALCARVKLLAGVSVFRRRLGVPPASRPLESPRKRPRIVGIGASTGGPQGLLQILSMLPTDFPLPILCVQHISSGFIESLVAWLDNACPLTVRLAAAGERPAAGQVCFCPENRHLVVREGGCLALPEDAPVNGHRPSVDLLFGSLARHYSDDAVAVLLSGMGRDGAAGMAAVSAAGGLTLAQDEASSVVYGMAAEAVKRGAVDHILPIEAIGPFLLQVAAA